MKIDGEWNLGYVLDWHTKSSEFLGHDQFGHPQYNTVRSEVGEAIFQLKYRSDLTKVDPLAETFVKNLQTFFQSASFIVPMPPSKHRIDQPLIRLARKISEKLNIPVFENVLLKNGVTSQMKNIENREKRIEALMKCFCINDTITNNGCWDVLIIDDLYDSGSSLTAATRALRTYSKVNNIYVGAFTKAK